MGVRDASKRGHLALLVAGACSGTPHTDAAPATCRIGDRGVAWATTGVADLDAIVGTCPPTLVCGEGRTLAAIGDFGPDRDGTLVCVDGRGRYDGPTIGVGTVGARRVWFRGAFHHEAPSGAWSCTDTATGERLDFEVDGVRWAKMLWGIGEDELDALSFQPGGNRLAPPPPNICPRDGWAALAREFVAPGLEHLGDLTKNGVVANVRHTP